MTEKFSIDKKIQTQIDNIRIKAQELKPLVVIRCITFNHKNYIKDALDGFLNQKTDFPFIAIIHDDASTDGTADIIKEYATRFPDIILPIFEEENQYSKDPSLVGHILNSAIEVSNAEFLAFCEGDDYWIDPLKLQKQVDFLNINKDIGMCYTSFDIKDEITNSYRYNLFKNEPLKFPSEYKSVSEFILKKGYVCPPSWLIRIKFWKTDLPSSLDGTFVRFADLLFSTKVAALSDVTAVYREIAESASRSSSYEKMYIRQKNLYQTQLKLIERFDLSPELKLKCAEDHYRKNLRSWVINSKHEDVREAYKFLGSKKSVREIFFFYIDFARLNFILMFLKKINHKLKNK